MLVEAYGRNHRRNFRCQAGFEHRLFGDGVHTVIGDGSCGNAQLLGSIVNWFDGEQTTAVISGKSLSAASLTVPNNMIIVLGLLFTIVLPIVCVVAGLVICVIRRRR